jgi:hypothetical protein
MLIFETGQGLERLAACQLFRRRFPRALSAGLRNAGQSLIAA